VLLQSLAGVDRRGVDCEEELCSVQSGSLGGGLYMCRTCLYVIFLIKKERFFRKLIVIFRRFGIKGQLYDRCQTLDLLRD
jgi:hypothetical protein